MRNPENKITRELTPSENQLLNYVTDAGYLLQNQLLKLLQRASLVGDEDHRATDATDAFCSGFELLKLQMAIVADQLEDEVNKAAENKIFELETRLDECRLKTK
ncbi:hypothetical protein [Pseudotamlana carrageenivorans]|uniref:Uncharacterized protein n=1 Tax=Pseudotamlana carrageenivorans TaxID=2069432 RepID=A0A2I7SET0_9FLAO|nr:hypothetical protein [Tamlana carrageenivorans]AUS04397.1 hypothetical protein C1A40_02425 [Tamlana carrageenivorans]